MRHLLMIIVALALSSFAFGQRLQQGELQLNAGLGFNSGGWDIPLYAGVDYCIQPDITVGGIVSYVSKDYKVAQYKDKGRWLSIGAKADYHFNTLLEIPNNWDVYAGLTLAYNSFSYDNNYSDINYENSKIGLSAQIGARYYFNENIGINLEFGGNNIASGGRIGISYKF